MINDQPDLAEVEPLTQEEAQTLFPKADLRRFAGTQRLLAVDNEDRLWVYMVWDLSAGNYTGEAYYHLQDLDWWHGPVPTKHYQKIPDGWATRIVSVVS